jgi:hypothetical protein
MAYLAKGRGAGNRNSEKRVLGRFAAPQNAAAKGAA